MQHQNASWMVCSQQDDDWLRAVKLCQLLQQFFGRSISLATLQYISRLQHCYSYLILIDTWAMLSYSVGLRRVWSYCMIVQYHLFATSVSAYNERAFSWDQEFRTWLCRKNKIKNTTWKNLLSTITLQIRREHTVWHNTWMWNAAYGNTCDDIRLGSLAKILRNNKQSALWIAHQKIQRITWLYWWSQHLLKELFSVQHVLAKKWQCTR